MTDVVSGSSLVLLHIRDVIAHTKDILRIGGKTLGKIPLMTHEIVKACRTTHDDCCMSFLFWRMQNSELKIQNGGNKTFYTLRRSVTVVSDFFT